MNPFYVESDGLKIAAETFGVGEPLIFAHGLTGNRHAIRRQFESLADRYRLVIFDQRGHCDSSPVIDPALYAPARMADDMRAVLDHLKIDRAIVGGESMGAATALIFALKYPQRVEKLLLTAPAFGDSFNPNRQGLQEMGDNVRRLGIEGFLIFNAAERQRLGLKWPADVAEIVANLLRSHDAASLATALRAVADWHLFTDLSDVAKLKCPVCILAWENDPLHPFDLARRLAATLPTAQLKMLPPLPAIFQTPQVVGELYKIFLEERL
ncbi:MAG: alpha/beta hydrolase [Chloroflexi bacterium]|nr:alpha/beta hydrolase [Chloroflexota bacterium]